MEIVNRRLEEIMPTAAERFSELVKAEYHRNLRVVIGLVGGRSMKDLFGIIPNLEFPHLDAMHFFWGDERCFPNGHNDRNDYVANEMLERLIERGYLKLIFIGLIIDRMKLIGVFLSIKENFNH